MTIYLNALILIAAVAVVIDLVLLVAITKTFREKKEKPQGRNYSLIVDTKLSMDY